MELIDPKRLAKLMAIQEVSPKQLALAVGWQSKTSVTRLLSGRYRVVKDVDKCARIAKHLGVGIDDLFLTKVSSSTGENGKENNAA